MSLLGLGVRAFLKPGPFVKTRIPRPDRLVGCRDSTGNRFGADLRREYDGPFERVDEVATADADVVGTIEDGEVQVGVARVARRAELGDPLAAGDPIPDGHRGGAPPQMLVPCPLTVGMFNPNPVAGRSAGPPRNTTGVAIGVAVDDRHHLAVGSGEDRDAGVHLLEIPQGEVSAVVIVVEPPPAHVIQQAGTDVVILIVHNHPVPVGDSPEGQRQLQQIVGRTPDGTVPQPPALLLDPGRDVERLIALRELLRRQGPVLRLAQVGEDEVRGVVLPVPYLGVAHGAARLGVCSHSQRFEAGHPVTADIGPIVAMTRIPVCSFWAVVGNCYWLCPT